MIKNRQGLKVFKISDLKTLVKFVSVSGYVQ